MFWLLPSTNYVRVSPHEPAELQKVPMSSFEASSYSEELACLAESFDIRISKQVLVSCDNLIDLARFWAVAGGLYLEVGM